MTPSIYNFIDGRTEGYYRWSIVAGGHCVKCLRPGLDPPWHRWLFRGTRIDAISAVRSAILSTGHLCDQHAIQREMYKRNKLTTK